MDRYPGLDHYVDGDVPGLLGHLATSALGAKIKMHVITSHNRRFARIAFCVWHRHLLLYVGETIVIVVCDIINGNNLIFIIYATRETEATEGTNNDGYQRNQFDVRWCRHTG